MSLRPGDIVHRLLAPWRRRRAAERLSRAARQRPLRVVIGAGGHFDPGWVDADIDVLNLLHEADWQRFFAPASIDALFAEHVWEHLEPADALAAARRCHAYLRPGGRLRIAVPDGHHPDPAYIAAVRPGGSGDGADDHRVLYTHESLSALLRAASFEPQLLEHFDADGRFHRVDWYRGFGTVRRSAAFDPRNQGGRLAYTSLIVDAVKPAAAEAP
jgi:predicted SAM-dependent methyltransferase